MSDELLRLAERVEGLTGPDRRLDAEIDCAVRFPHLRPAEPGDHKEYQRGYPPSPGDIWCPTGFLMAQSYTRSLDDAMSLVPNGKEWLFARTHYPHDGGKAYFYASIEESQVHYAATPALALTAACLRARAAAARGE